MGRIESDDVRVYVVWMPVLRHDSEEVAAEAAATVTDARARHYWNPDVAIGRETSRVLRISDQLAVAWDVYLVYRPDAHWSGPSAMPEPSAWMHRLTAPDDPRYMTAEQMRKVIAALLPE